MAYLTLFLFPFLLLERWRATRWRAFASTAAVGVLLVYLARSPKRARARDHLIGLLWGDEAEKDARHSLNQAVSTLRIYAGKGLDGIRTFGWKGQPSALTPHRGIIEEEFRERPPHTAHEATRRIEELTGVKRKASRMPIFSLRATWTAAMRVMAPPNKAQVASVTRITRIR